METAAWHRHFVQSSLRPLPSTAFDGTAIPEPLRSCLARSIATFQLGETGEGRIAAEIRRLRGVDEDYCRALTLFVKEEGRHARILAGLVRSLGGELLARQATARLFVAARRLLGVRTKLLVLLAAEVIGIGFYSILAERAPDAVLAAALGEIADDERHHLAFHSDFFRARATTPLRRGAFRAAWLALSTAAAATVLGDHRRTLHALGVPVRDAACRLFALARHAAARVAEGDSHVRSLPDTARAVE
ncbi:MAG TPA: ferritin-like domain-containing protein [Thermoanaerobaculia bacterium]|nr:ferritin-like domain-containing protein [Thermoanaerobaculia bacterium]